MLLTSSQVSVLVTSGIVLLFTSALFISGCLIQQRTLRDLRSAIRPAVVTRPRPRYWDTEALSSSSSSAGRTRIRLEDGTMVEVHSPAGLDPSARAQAQVLEDKEGVVEEEEGQVIEIRSTPPDDDVEYPAQEPDREDADNDDDNRRDDGSSSLDDKEESASSSSWDGVQEGGTPLSRAERRRRIKAEIQRLAHADKPVYYQRRLW